MISQAIFISTLSEDQTADLDAPISSSEIFNMFKKTGRSKSHGPVGFTVEFFAKAWGSIGHDVTAAVWYFFENTFIPRIVNSTAIALVPKLPNPTKMIQFRPILSCNFLYKFVGKIRCCVTSCMLAVKINGSLEGYFNGCSGLRQGDPLSPNLVVLYMEVLTRCINEVTASREILVPLEM
ncbi:hypothetical protein AgCh_032680 [Apium graveolens]